jgi:hypothetical protein
VFAHMPALLCRSYRSLSWFACLFQSSRCTTTLRYAHTHARTHECALCWPMLAALLTHPGLFVIDRWNLICLSTLRVDRSFESISMSRSLVCHVHVCSMSSIVTPPLLCLFLSLSLARLYTHHSRMHWSCRPQCRCNGHLGRCTTGRGAQYLQTQTDRCWCSDSRKRRYHHLDLAPHHAQQSLLLTNGGH